MTEGSVKFAVHLHEVELPEIAGLAQLNALRTELHDLRLVGTYPDGVGYGNVSLRLGDSGVFVISGTATGAKRVLEVGDYCRVDRFDLEANEVYCSGRRQASAETLSHGAVYLARPEVGCVLHVHSRALFDHLLANHYPATAPTAAYGTPEMAREIVALVAAQPAAEALLVMAGHEEGVIAYGRRLEQARERLLAALRAMRR